jgi:hypothetical protein
MWSWFLAGVLIGAFLFIIIRPDNDDNDDDGDFEEGCRVAFIHMTMDDFL